MRDYKFNIVETMEIIKFNISSKFSASVKCP